MAQEIQTRIARMWLDESGFVQVRYKKGAVMELVDAQELGDQILSLTGGVPGYIVSDLEIKGFASDARTYAARPEFSRKLVAVAAFGQSAVGRLIATIFLRLQRPPYQLRLFATEEQAAEWLRKARGDAAT